MDAIRVRAVHFLVFFILSNIFIEAFILHVRNTQNISKSQHESDYWKQDMGQDVILLVIFPSWLDLCFWEIHNCLFWKNLQPHFDSCLLDIVSNTWWSIFHQNYQEKKEAQTRNIQHIVSYCTVNSLDKNTQLTGVFDGAREAAQQSRESIFYIFCFFSYMHASHKCFRWVMLKSLHTPRVLIMICWTGSGLPLK